jgi:hypothetical protein
MCTAFTILKKISFHDSVASPLDQSAFWSLVIFFCENEETVCTWWILTSPPQNQVIAVSVSKSGFMNNPTGGMD